MGLRSDVSLAFVFRSRAVASTKQTGALFMYASIMSLIGQLAPIAVLGLIGGLLFRRDFNIRWLLMALALYAINDFLLTRGFGTLPRLLPPMEWNWQGKILALTVTLIIASLPQFGLKRIGLTWHQGEKPWPAYVLTAVLAALFFVLAVTDGSGPGNIETIAFQWTMPGFEEEVFYRGTLLLALNEAFRRKINILGAPIGYGGVLATILFGLGHAAGFGGEGFVFEGGAFLETGVPAFILLWLRERTGSLVLPVLGHNIANGASELI